MRRRVFSIGTASEVLHCLGRVQTGDWVGDRFRPYGAVDADHASSACKCRSYEVFALLCLTVVFLSFTASAIHPPWLAAMLPYELARAAPRLEPPLPFSRARTRLADNTPSSNRRLHRFCFVVLPSTPFSSCPTASSAHGRTHGVFGELTHEGSRAM